jgi:hypothetical protein
MSKTTMNAVARSIVLTHRSILTCSRALAMMVISTLMVAACRPTGPVTSQSHALPGSGGAAPASSTPLRQRWLEMFARGYFPGRSGQIFVVPREGDVITERDPLYTFMHGSPWDYDTRIPVLFHGPAFIRQGQGGEAVSQQDIAPTLAALLHMTPVASVTGRVLTNALSPGAARPRVIAPIVLDAMRADYFDRYAGVMPTLTRMRREGA